MQIWNVLNCLWFQTFFASHIVVVLGCPRTTGFDFSHLRATGFVREQQQATKLAGNQIWSPPTVDDRIWSGPKLISADRGQPDLILFSLSDCIEAPAKEIVLNCNMWSYDQFFCHSDPYQHAKIVSCMPSPDFLPAPKESWTLEFGTSTKLNLT